MVDMVINGLAEGAPLEQVAKEAGLSVPDIQAVHNSPLIQLWLSINNDSDKGQEQ